MTPRSDRLRATVRSDDDYARGLLDGIARFSFTSSEPWAENGVRYVGTTGTTLERAFEEALRERGYSLGEPRPDYDPRVDHPERYREGPI